MAIHSYERELEREILAKLKVDSELRRKTKEFAEDVRDYARRRALEDMDRGYATGTFVASIQVERRRNARGQFEAGPGWRVASHDPKANLLEYGTGVDTELGSPWGPNTPTPEYATFAKTAFHFHGTPDSKGGFGSSTLDAKGKSIIAIGKGEKRAKNVRPIRQYAAKQGDPNNPDFVYEEPQGMGDLRDAYDKWLQSPEAISLRGGKFNGKGNRG